MGGLGQHARKDLGVGGWGLENPYGIRILNPLEIRPFKTECVFCINWFWKLDARARKHNKTRRNLHKLYLNPKEYGQWLLKHVKGHVKNNEAKVWQSGHKTLKMNFP